MGLGKVSGREGIVMCDGTGLERLDVFRRKNGDWEMLCWVAGYTSVPSSVRVGRNQRVYNEVSYASFTKKYSRHFGCYSPLRDVLTSGIERERVPFHVPSGQ